MKTLTIDLHPGAGKPITYTNATSWDWDDYGIRVELDNGTIVRFNSTYVIALVCQEIEEGTTRASDYPRRARRTAGGYRSSARKEKTNLRRP
jgi:hypothetical protein